MVKLKLNYEQTGDERKIMTPENDDRDDTWMRVIV